MASTYSTNLGLELIGTGDQSGTWGATTNTNLGTLLEEAIGGYVTQAITDGSAATTTITIPNGASGVARNMFIEMTGALTYATTSLIVPAKEKMYFVYNNTSGGFAVTVKVSGQTGILVPNGKKVVLTCNGTDIVEAHTAIVGNATMGGTLGVTGATTLSSTLGVTGVTTVAAGSAALPAIVSTTGTADTGLWFPAADTVAASTGGTERIRIDSSGNVGIGTSTPSGKLDIATGTTATAINSNNGLDTGFVLKYASTLTSLGNNFNQPLAFLTNNTERMRIDALGNVGIGTSSPSTYGKLAVNGNVYAGDLISTSDGTITIGSNGAGSVAITRTGTGATSSSMTFSTTYATLQERMRIDSSGNVGIGNSAPTAALHVYGNNGTYGLSSFFSLNGSTPGVGIGNTGSVGLIQGLTTATGTVADLQIQPNGGYLLVGTTSVLNNSKVTIVHPNPQIVTRHGSATAGKFWNSPYINSSNQFYIINQDNAGVYITDGATAWTANSDERLKDIIAPIASALEGVQSLRAVKYSWKSDEAKVPHIGLIAQDVQKVLPEVVTSAKLPMSEDETEYLGVSYTEVIPLLVAAIQELSAKVTALESR